MDALIHDWGMLAAWVFGGTLGMMLFFAFAVIVVTKVGEDTILGKAVIIVFSFFNALYNTSLGSILCMELPQRIGEPSTERLKRYKRIYDDSDTGIRWWRLRVARGVCWWLNIWDKAHC